MIKQRMPSLFLSGNFISPSWFFYGLACPDIIHHLEWISKNDTGTIANCFYNKIYDDAVLKGVKTG
jgi:hypothetical protein